MGCNNTVTREDVRNRNTGQASKLAPHLLGNDTQADQQPSSNGGGGDEANRSTTPPTIRSRIAKQHQHRHATFARNESQSSIDSEEDARHPTAGQNFYYLGGSLDSLQDRPRSLLYDSSCFGELVESRSGTVRTRTTEGSYNLQQQIAANTFDQEDVDSHDGTNQHPQVYHSTSRPMTNPSSPFITEKGPHDPATQAVRRNGNQHCDLDPEESQYDADNTHHHHHDDENPDEFLFEVEYLPPSSALEGALVDFGGDNFSGLCGVEDQEQRMKRLEDAAEYRAPPLPPENRNSIRLMRDDLRAKVFLRYCSALFCELEHCPRCTVCGLCESHVEYCPLGAEHVRQSSRQFCGIETGPAFLAENFMVSSYVQFRLRSFFWLRYQREEDARLGRHGSHDAVTVSRHQSPTDNKGAAVGEEAGSFTGDIHISLFDLLVALNCFESEEGQLNLSAELQDQLFLLVYHACARHLWTAGSACAELSPPERFSLLCQLVASLSLDGVFLVLSFREDHQPTLHVRLNLNGFSNPTFSLFFNSFPSFNELCSVPIKSKPTDRALLPIFSVFCHFGIPSPLLLLEVERQMDAVVNCCDESEAASRAARSYAVLVEERTRLLFDSASLMSKSDKAQRELIQAICFAVLQRA